ncbi:MAG: hypothetical protein MI924_36535 [Chloroflexales bacterium]|nr:hypothetical protein [Chloroflexales bacterium]
MNEEFTVAVDAEVIGGHHDRGYVNAWFAVGPWTVTDLAQGEHSLIVEHRGGGRGWESVDYLLRLCVKTRTLSAPTNPPTATATQAPATATATQAPATATATVTATQPPATATQPPVVTTSTAVVLPPSVRITTPVPTMTNTPPSVRITTPVPPTQKKAPPAPLPVVVFPPVAPPDVPAAVVPASCVETHQLGAPLCARAVEPVPSPVVFGVAIPIALPDTGSTTPSLGLLLVVAVILLVLGAIGVRLALSRR